MLRRIIGLGFLITLFLIIRAEAKFTSQGIKYWSAPDHTRIVVALRRKTTPKAKFYSKINAIVVYFKGYIKGVPKSKIDVNDSLIQSIRLYRSGSYNKLFIRLKKKTSYRVFTLKKFKNRPFRIVIDVLQPQKVLIEEKKIRKLIAKKTKKERKFIIVIDPGHGGSDPGAIGLYGLREKDIVFDIARRIKRYFDRDPRFAAFLTRRGDYYVPLTKRVEIAHDYSADLFISIHSNSAPNRRLSGIMAFVLSEKGVRSSLVKMLEDVENTEDMIKDIELKKSKSINSLVLKVTHDYSSIEGKKASEYILAYLDSMCGMKSRGIRKAGFVVLKNPGIPSLLLEMGFLSNPHDARMLLRRSFRESVAFCVYRGIRSYFVDKQNMVKLRRRVYMVKKGDSLWKIARLYGVDMRSLIRANRLKGKRIYPGMKLIIP